MTRRKPRPPLTEATLDELALTYVGRFATTRAKLGRYLQTKIRERGWDGQGAPAIEAIVERFARNGYVDDAAFALSKARSLSGRGYGEGRVRQGLRAAGIAEDDARPAQQLAREEAVQSALRFASRRRLGPFAAEPIERDQREKALAAMVRAGHSFGIAKAILALPPGAAPDADALAASLGGDLIEQSRFPDTM